MTKDECIDIACSCPVTNEADCLFCWYSTVDTYLLKKGRSNAACARCSREQQSITYHFHPECVNAVCNWCPSVKDRSIGFENIISLLLNHTRALTRPTPTANDGRRFLNYFHDRPVQDMIGERVSSALLNKLTPEIQLNICRFLEPFPPMVAVAQTQRLLESVANPRQARRKATYLERILPGKLLYLTFRHFRGVQYLADIQEKGNEFSSQPLLLSASKLVVSRDHFGIFDLRCVDGNAGLEATSKTLTYYSVFGLEEGNSKGLSLWACSDGLFLRTLIPAPDRLTMSPVIEWDTPAPPRPKCVKMFQYPLNVLPSSVPWRRNYHDVKNITGISAVVRNRKTIALFTHPNRWSYSSFTANLEHSFPDNNLIFIFFPLAHQEQIHAVGLRRLQGLSFPACSPVIQISTSCGRTCIFGPAVHAQFENNYDYEVMRPTLDAEIEGLFHSPVSRSESAFEEVGISTSDGDVVTSKNSICPTLHDLAPPLGAPNLDCYESKVCLDGVTTLQICKVAERAVSCRGLLVTYSNGDRECLGQFRFDKYLSPPIEVSHCYFSTKKLGFTYYVSVRTRGEYDMIDSEHEWSKFPTHGTVYWWFGPHGNFFTTNEGLDMVS